MDTIVKYMIERKWADDEKTDRKVFLWKLAQKSTCVNPFVDNINAVNRIYNEPVEVLFDSENIYFSLPEATPA